MSNIYDAIMKAADHIERHPEEFEFMETRVPRSCGSPGCAIGWIGHFAKTKPARLFGLVPERPEYAGKSIGVVCRQVIGVGGRSFYRRLDATGHRGWQENPDACAKALRAYAQKYHAPQTPDWEALAKPDAGFRQEVSA